MASTATAPSSASSLFPLDTLAATALAITSDFRSRPSTRDPAPLFTTPSTSRPPTHPPQEELDRSLQAGALYAALLFRGDFTSWEWAFFIAQPESGGHSPGEIFHVGGDAGPDAVHPINLAFTVDTVQNLADAVALVRLADLHGLGSYTDVVDALKGALGNVDVTKQQSSRAWFVEAIGVLDDCGFVSCEDAFLLERELKRCAFMAMDTYLEGGEYRLFTSKNCS